MINHEPWRVSTKNGLDSAVQVPILSIRRCRDRYSVLVLYTYKLYRPMPCQPGIRMVQTND